MYFYFPLYSPSREREREGNICSCHFDFDHLLLGGIPFNAPVHNNIGVSVDNAHPHRIDIGHVAQTNYYMLHEKVLTCAC